MDEQIDDLFAVTRAVWEYLSENLMGYLFASLVMFGILVVGSLGSIALIGIAFIPAAVMQDESVFQISAIVGSISAAGVLFVLTVVMALAQASLIRALNNHIAGGLPVAWNSPFSTLSQNAPGIIVFFVLTGLLTTIAAMCCYLPAIPVWALTAFAMPIVAIEGAGTFEALQLAGRHMADNLVWHLGVWVVLFVILLALGATGVGSFLAVPIVVAHQVFAYRMAFGDEGATRPGM